MIITALNLTLFLDEALLIGEFSMYVALYIKSLITLVLLLDAELPLSHALLTSEIPAFMLGFLKPRLKWFRISFLSRWHINHAQCRV